MPRVANVLHERLADSRSDHEGAQLGSRLFIDARLEAFRLGTLLVGNPEVTREAAVRDLQDCRGDHPVFGVREDRSQEHQALERLFFGGCGVGRLGVQHRQLCVEPGEKSTRAWPAIRAALRQRCWNNRRTG
jgi:hypothetical protein